MTKMHLRVEGHIREDKDGFWFCESKCGTASNWLTTNLGLVTCKHCLRGVTVAKRD